MYGWYNIYKIVVIFNGIYFNFTCDMKISTRWLYFMPNFMTKSWPNLHVFQLKVSAYFIPQIFSSWNSFVSEEKGNKLIDIAMPTINHQRCWKIYYWRRNINSVVITSVYWSTLHRDQNIVSQQRWLFQHLC